MAVGPGLVFAGEVQVDIRHLAAAVAQERLKGDVEPVLDVFRAALRAAFVRHIRPAAVAAVGDKFHVAAVGAAVVRRQGVHFGDAGHIGHQRGANGATGAHQIAVFQTALDQLLGGHIHHVILPQDAAQLHIQPVHHQLGRLVAVQGVALVPDQAVQVLLGVFQPGREQLARRQQLDLLHQVGDVAGVVDDHLAGQLLPQIGELLQHLGGGFEVDGQGRVGVGELLAGQKDMAVGLVLRLLEVDVAGGADGLVQLPAQADDGAVELPQLLLGPDVAVAEHEHIVADGLNFQIVVKRRDAPELGPVLVVLHRLEQLPGLAGGANDEALPVGHQLGFGDDGHPLEVLQVGGGDQLVQVLEAHFVLGQQDDVLGEAAGLAAPGPQLQHLGVDVLEEADAQLLFHLLEKRDQHVGHHGRIVGGPVVVEGRQVQILGHDVQLELVQLRQEILGQDQGVHIGGVKGDALPAAAGPDEADVELGVVGRQGAAVHKGQKGRQGLLGGGGVGKHGVGDAGEADDLRRQAAAGIHEGLEPVGDLAVFQHHGTDLGDGLPVHLQAGGLDIEADDLVGEVLVLGTVDGDAVV